MDNIFNLTTLLVAGLVTVLVYLFFKRTKNSPPGPRSYPLLGSVGFFRNLKNTLPHKAFAQAAEKYGGVLSVSVGPKSYVILNGYDAIYQAFVKQASDFNDRPTWLPQLKGLENGKGVSWSNGQEWNTMRRFTSKSLRQFGVGKASIEHKIQEECQIVFQLLRNSLIFKDGGKEVWHMAACNIVSSMIFGHRFDYGDETFAKLLSFIDITLNAGTFIDVINFLPKFLHHPLFPAAYKRLIAMEKATKEYYETVLSLMESRKLTFDPDSIHDYLDIYIQSTIEGSDFSKSEHLHKGNVLRVIRDIFLAGTGTVANTLNWMFLYMIEYPEVQQKCRKMLEDVIGDRLVTLEDKSKLPYIEATIHEVQRLSNVVPLGVPRTCVDHDVTLLGFTIPKKTLVLPNIYSAHTDPKYWDRPLEFDPQRFLDSENKLKNNVAFIPLSLGPRNCVGESLAKSELFLFFSNLIAKFEFSHEHESTKHDLSPTKGKFVTLAPSPYNLKCVPVI